MMRFLFLCGILLLCASVAWAADDLAGVPFSTNEALELRGVARAGDTVSGTGTADCVAKFTGTTDIGCSQATDDGTDFTIGTAFTITASATSGVRNTFVGENAGLNNTSGIDNVFVGQSAGLNNTSGVRNTFVGGSAGRDNTGGSNNVFVGLNAGRFIANGSTAHEAGNTSIFIGKDTKANADAETNQIVIGFDATGHGSNTMTLGNTSLTQVISDMGTGFAQYTLDGANGGCLMLRDTDDAGWSQIVILNGTITASADDGDGVCD